MTNIDELWLRRHEADTALYAAVSRIVCRTIPRPKALGDLIEDLRHDATTDIFLRLDRHDPSRGSVAAFVTAIAKCRWSDEYRRLKRKNLPVFVSFDDPRRAEGDDDSFERDSLMAEAVRQRETESYSVPARELDLTEASLDDRSFVEAMLRHDANLTQAAAELKWSRKKARCALERLRRLEAA